MDVQWDTKLTLVSDSIKKTYMWRIIIFNVESLILIKYYNYNFNRNLGTGGRSYSKPLEISCRSRISKLILSWNLSYVLK